MATVRVYLETLTATVAPAGLTGPEEVFAAGLAGQLTGGGVRRELLAEFDHDGTRGRARVEGFRRGREALARRGVAYDATAPFERAGDLRLWVEAK